VISLVMKLQTFIDVGANRGRFIFGILTHWGDQRMRDTDMRLKALNVDVGGKRQVMVLCVTTS
jgi:hypothetical protein